MKIIKKIEYAALLFTLLSITGYASPKGDKSFTLWYKQPAKEWMGSIPVGNGRLGAMIYGGVDEETLALNEISLWSGQPDSTQNDLCGKENLAQIRKLFFEGDIPEGNRLGTKFLSGHGKSFGTHLPLGDLKISFTYNSGETNNYCRELDLENSIATVSFDKGDVHFIREYFCSKPDEVFAIRVAANKPGQINTKLSLDLLRKSSVKINQDGLFLSGQALFPNMGPGGVHFVGMIRIVPKGGKVSVSDNLLKIEKADELYIYADIRTDFNSKNYQQICKKTIGNCLNRGYQQMRHSHISDYRNLYGRMQISLGEDKSNLPTDERWMHIKKGETDPAFDALFYQYGRDMLISSSRKGSPLPANLQGIWNDNLACNMPWTCDYHLDINIEQNYWAANVANLAECNEPLFSYLALLAKAGHETAKKMYGCDGWVAHTITNVWGYTAPGGEVGWGLCPSAGAWQATQLWKHYLYTMDKEYLAKVGYPLLKKTAQFFVDYMVEDPNTGYLVTGPSISPENGFSYKGETWSLSMMPTIDRAVVYYIYNACIESSKILNIDSKFRSRLEKDIKRLPPLAVSKEGTIKEWLLDVERADPNHRHSSHLISLYPLDEISYTKTPRLMSAARKSIEKQLSAPKWEDTEWSRANMINFFARTKDADKAYHSLQGLYREFMRENLMTVSPAGIAGAEKDIFSFDATEAGVAGISEMLLQSYDGFIEFLPSLPSQWIKGAVSGICAEGGLVVNMSWNNSKIVNAKIKSMVKHSFSILLPEAWGTPHFEINNQIITPVKDGQLYRIDMIQQSVLTIKY